MTKYTEVMVLWIPLRTVFITSSLVARGYQPSPGMSRHIVAQEEKTKI